MSEFPCSHFIYMYTTHLAVPYLPIRFNRGRLISCSRAPGSWATYVIHAVSAVPIRAVLVDRNMQDTWHLDLPMQYNVTQCYRNVM
jgi:hypothetical protein